MSKWEDWEDYDVVGPGDSDNYYNDDYSLEEQEPLGELEYSGDGDELVVTDQEYSLGRHNYYVNNSELQYLVDEEEDDELENRDYRPVRTRRDGKSGCLGGLMYAVFVISLSIILACVAWMAASDVLALNKDEGVGVVTIEKDFDMDDIIVQLKDQGLIEYKALFRLYSQISSADEKINPGTYELNTNFDYRALVAKMQTGSEAQQATSLTFPEGYSIKQIFAKLEEGGISTQEELYDTCANYDYSHSFLEGLPLGSPTRLEGYLFPDTYDFYEGESSISVINKFLNNTSTRITAEMFERAEEMDRSWHDIITIASMIEKEAADDDERGHIASVIYNRLNIGQELGIDATVHYLLDEPKEKLSAEDLEIDSPYNTRKYAGLPPGPIASPGIASINAALHPDNTGDFYYALNTETGKHEFFVYKTSFDAFVETQDYGE